MPMRPAARKSQGTAAAGRAVREEKGTAASRRRSKGNTCSRVSGEKWNGEKGPRKGRYRDERHPEQLAERKGR
jgi:hypothetical protein